VLAAAGVRATFFLQGRWVEAYPGTARRYRDAGHLIGNHSFYHARMPLLTDVGLRTDVRAAERAIRRILGVDPRPWFRLPFGTGADDARVLSALASTGYRHVGWDVDVQEWRPRLSQRAVERLVVDAVSAHGDGAVVLMHTWPSPVRALDAILARLRAEGAKFVRLDELASATAAAGSAVGSPAG
jgi:peptidoglycan/xylan/chitin deacetylase (PgdA/CDA1 family)